MIASGTATLSPEANAGSDWRFGDAVVRVTISDETGRIDINAAPVTLLAALFRAAGSDAADAVTLADAVDDFRGPPSVAVCREGLQWLYQRQRPGYAGGGTAWDTLGYCVTRTGLMQLRRARSGAEAPEIAALPEFFESGGRPWRAR